MISSVTQIHGIFFQVELQKTFLDLTGSPDFVNLLVRKSHGASTGSLRKVPLANAIFKDDFLLLQQNEGDVGLSWQ